MALIVQKYGGTSVADAGARACLVGKVRDAAGRGDEVVLVVSAMGRRGAPYATDTLLDLLREAGTADPARAVAPTTARAAQAPEPDGLTSDLLVSCGETISACLVSALLSASGLPAAPMTAYTAGIRAEGPQGDATPTGADAAAIMAVLRAGTVPVITGFQAVGPGGQVLTLGRGGSDTSAALIGVAIKADYVDIYTDVPGVAKADPRVVKEAPFMEFLDYESMFRLAKQGARVLHDKSALIAQRGRSLLRVRSTFDSGEGTLIGPEGTVDSAGRALRAPDFIGLAQAAWGEGTVRVAAVFARGRGGPGIRAAVGAAAATGARPAETDGDPDAVAFLCPAADSAALARRLFDALG